MKSLELAIAWRYLRSRRGSRLLSLISVIAIGGVVVGVSALIVIMGVMNGMQRDLRDKILVGSADINVLPWSEDLRLRNWAAVRDEVAKIPGVAAAAPFVQTQGVILNPSGFTTGARVYGIEPDGVKSADVTTIRSHAILGDFSFRTADGARGVVIGKLLASKLGTFLNDTVVLIGAGSLQMNASTGAIIPRADSFVVTGVFETGMYEYDDSFLYLDLHDAQRFAGIGEDVTGIEVRTTNRELAPTVADSLRSHMVETPIRAVDWQENNQALFQALTLEKLGMGVILLLIVIVAAFNIVSTLTMVVTDKTREIGILKAMGMSAKSIRRIFLLQGVVIGAVGTAGGLVLGLGVAVLLERYHLISLDPKIYFIDHLPVAVQWVDVVLIVLASLATAAVATLYPAGQAAKLYPVDAIRHE